MVTDVRTQAMYQMLDEGFVGLIFSTFNEDKHSKVFLIWFILFIYLLLLFF